MNISDTKALEKLLELSRLQANDCAGRVADLEAALASTDASIDWLKQAVRSEEVALDANPQGLLDLKRFLAGAKQKRLTLQATRDTLAVQIEAAREALLEALTEQKKFEHLMERIGASEMKQAVKLEQHATDEAAGFRFVR